MVEYFWNLAFLQLSDEGPAGQRRKFPARRYCTGMLWLRTGTGNATKHEQYRSPLLRRLLYHSEAQCVVHLRSFATG